MIDGVCLNTHWNQYFLSKKRLIVAKILQPVGIALLFFAGLNGFEDILGKKCA
jgi:hypothetical protein